MIETIQEHIETLSKEHDDLRNEWSRTRITNPRIVELENRMEQLMERILKLTHQRDSLLRQERAQLERRWQEIANILGTDE